VAVEDRERQKAEEVASLKQSLESLSLELNDKNIQQSDMERQLKYFKECSEKADLLTAKLMEAEDCIKSQDAMIRKLQSEATGIPARAPPTLASDQSLLDELAKKDAGIAKMEGTLASLECALGSMNGQRLKSENEARQLAETNADLRELINALQSQNEMDKAEWAALRVDLEQQIQILSDRVAAFENSYSGASFNNQRQEQDETPILHHRDAQHHHASSGAQWVECPRCRLPMATQGPHPCPSIIDGLD